MNCVAIQNKILALPDPRQVPDPLRGHLDACPACLGWWRQAARLERLLEQLPAPAPPAGKKDALLDELGTAGPIIRSVPTAIRGTGPSRLRGLLTRRVAAYAGGLAAAVLLAVGVGRLFTGNHHAPPTAEKTPRHPLLEQVVQRDVALARTASPEKRLEILGGLADDLTAETKALARVASPEDLEEMANQFGEVVNEGIVPRAQKIKDTRALTPDQKTVLFKGLAAKLADAGSAVDQLARESPPGAQPALRRIAATAQGGQARLLELVR